MTVREAAEGVLAQAVRNVAERKRQRAAFEQVAGRIRARLPELYPLQQEIASSPAKRKVIVIGRRAGKTTLAADVAAEGMLEGRRVLYGAPTADQTDAFWDSLTEWLGSAVGAGHIKQNETKRLLRCPATGGRIRAKTAWNADTLRGDHADLLILDEYALMDPSAWDEVGAPMLLDNNGDAWFIFTPKRKNHAYHLYVKSLQDETGRRAAWNAASTVNPHLSPEALAEITSDMSEDAYRQEIEAQFLDSEGVVFRIREGVFVPARADGWRWVGEDGPEAHAGHQVVAGVDWAKSGDYHAASFLCVTCAREVELHRYTGKDYTLQRQRLAGAVRVWGVARLEVEANAMGEPNIELLRRGEKTDTEQYPPLPVRPFTMTASSKPPLIEALTLTLERIEVRWLDVPVATAEIEAYEGKASPRTGHMAYSAPAGLHDDTVIARALARRAAGHGLGATGKLKLAPAWGGR